MKRFLPGLLIAGMLLAVGVAFVSQPAARAEDDTLPSWQDTSTKQALLEFVRGVCTPGGAGYLEPEQRVAVFDNDGTLWCEKPLYVHFTANFGRFAELLKADPGLGEKQPYKALAEKDKGYFVGLYEAGKIEEIVGDLLGVPFEGMSPEQHEAWHRTWLRTWKHARFGVGYRQLVYQPMVELIGHLQKHGFEVYISTADEGAYVKLLSQELYGVPPESVLGSSVELTFDGKHLSRTAKAQFLNNWDGKPRQIFERLGKRPILAVGNSNGDLQMLQYTAAGEGPRMSVMVHHTDGEREYAYDAHTDKIMPAAKTGGWTIVDMKKDWRRVFPGQR